jgi:TRAP-type C4-dicarboxylate transport system substrate-binding protein
MGLANMINRSIGLGTLAFAALAMAIGTAAAQVKWDLANEYQASSLFGQGNQFFAEAVKRNSGGKMEINLHLGGSLGYKSKDHFDAVGGGAIQIADSYTGAWIGMDQLFNVSALPFLTTSVGDVRALYEAAKPFYQEVFAKNNQMLLMASPWPPTGIWGKKPIDSAAAIKNLKIRTYDPNGTLVMKAIGAIPVQLSWSDVIPQLATGNIQSVLTSAEGGVSAKFWDHLSHFTEINYAMPLSMLHVNKAALDKLPDDLKKAVLDAAAATEKHNWEAVVHRVEQNYADMRKNNMTIVANVPKEYLDALTKAADEAHKQWAQKAGERGEKILADYRRRIGRSS